MEIYRGMYQYIWSRQKRAGRFDLKNFMLQKMSILNNGTTAAAFVFVLGSH